MKEYGAEARKVLVEQQRLWAEEDARDAKQKTADAKGAKPKGVTKADSGPPSTSLDDYDPAGGMGPNAWLRQQKKAKRQYEKNQRHAANLKAEKRGMGIRLEDWGDYFSWTRSYDPDAKKKPGAGDGDQPSGPGGDPAGPPQGGDAAPQPPSYPSHPPVITEGGDGPPKGSTDAASEATKALGDTATATKAAAEAVGQLAAPAKEAADGAKQTADAATALDAPVKDLATGMTDAAAGLDAVRSSVGEAVTGVTQVVKAVNDLRTEMARLKQALDQLSKAA